MTSPTLIHSMQASIYRDIHALKIFLRPSILPGNIGIIVPKQRNSDSSAQVPVCGSLRAANRRRTKPLRGMGAPIRRLVTRFSCVACKLRKSDAVSAQDRNCRSGFIPTCRVTPRGSENPCRKTRPARRGLSSRKDEVR